MRQVLMMALMMAVTKVALFELMVETMVEMKVATMVGMTVANLVLMMDLIG